MRQNRATSAPFFYCVSYEILCETRIKPSFFGNCLISLSSAGGNCVRAAGKLPSQSPSGDSSPEGGAKSRLPLWGALVPSGHRSAFDRASRRECHAKGMTKRASLPAPLCGPRKVLFRLPLARSLHPPAQFQKPLDKSGQRGYNSYSVKQSGAGGPHPCSAA